MATTNTPLLPFVIRTTSAWQKKSCHVCPMHSLNHSANLRLPAVSWSTDGPSWQHTHTDKCQLSKCQNLFLILGTPVLRQYFIYGLHSPWQCQAVAKVKAATSASRPHCGGPHCGLRMRVSLASARLFRAHCVCAAYLTKSQQRSAFGTCTSFSCLRALSWMSQRKL